MSWFRRHASPDVPFWQIVKYSFLCNAPSASRPTKIKTTEQTARSPRGVISAAVDGCSSADTPVNHGRNSLKRPRKRKKNKSLDSRSSLLSDGREHWHFAFHLGKGKLLNKDLQPELFYLWLKLMVITNTQTDRIAHASVPWCISPAKMFSSTLKGQRHPSSFVSSEVEEEFWDRLNPTNENSQPNTTTSVFALSNPGFMICSFNVQTPVKSLSFVAIRLSISLHL